MNAYEILVNDGEGWKRVALLPVTLGWALVTVIAEESQIAWTFPIRVVRGSEMLMELGAALPLAKAG